METTINEKQVLYTSKEAFTYDGVDAAKLKELNSNLFTQVKIELANYIDNKVKIDEENRVKKNTADANKKNEMVESFKRLILAKRPKLKEYELVFKTFTPANTWGEPRDVSIKHKTSYVDVVYDGEVWSSGSWHGHATSKPWKVIVNYKTVRYGDLDKALDKAVEKLIELVTQRQQIDDKEAEKNRQEAEMKIFAESNGFTFEKVWHRSAYYDGGVYKYKMSKPTLNVEIAYNEEKKSVVIKSYTIFGRDITIDEVKKVA